MSLKRALKNPLQQRISYVRTDLDRDRPVPSIVFVKLVASHIESLLWITLARREGRSMASRGSPVVFRPTSSRLLSTQRAWEAFVSGRELDVQQVPLLF
jgi:hypothetical protein